MPLFVDEGLDSMSLPPHPRPSLVFVSYDPNEAGLRGDVLDLANRLRHDGVDARIDLYEPGPAEGWELWRERQLLAAELVIVVCTASYRRCFEAHDPAASGLQIRWEAGFVRRRLHDDPGFGARVLPVVLHDASTDVVPEVLRGYTRYALPSGYDELYRRITGQPENVWPSLGKLGQRIDNLGRRSLVFEGRDDDLDATRDALRRSSKLATYTVLTGMGGIGKTRLALEHAHRCESDYDVRWWVRAGDPASLRADLVRLGVELGILTEPERVEASTREVLAWLSSHQRWLVVYDDAEAPTTLRELLPSPCRGHLVITSRAWAWRSTAQVMKLAHLSSAAAREVLLGRAGRPDDGHADAVAELLGRLPLALVQAGAYIEAAGCSFRDCLELFEREGLALLDDPKSAPDGDHETVAATWAISLAEIRTRAPAAAELLDWLAFLDPGGVSIRLLREHVAAMPTSLHACVGSSRALDDAIAVLRAFGLVERDEGVLRVHRLIQAVTRDELAPEEQRRLGGAVVRWLCRTFAYTPGETPVRAVPSGVAEQIMAASAIDACARADAQRLAQTLIDVGDFQLMRGASHAAHAAYRRSLELRETCADAEPGRPQARRELSIALNRLGSVEARAGNLDVARRCFARAFALRKELAYHDPLSPRSQDDLASSLGKLGDVELLDNDVAAAAELFAQAVDLREALVELAPEDTLARRALALSSRKLGKAQARLGDLDDARRTLRRALAIVESLARLDPHDPVVRRDLSLVLGDLASVLLHDDDHAPARELHARSLALAEELAAEDPGNAQAQRDLSIGLDRHALAESHAGRLVEARRAMERSLELRQALARANPQDAQAQQDLACSLTGLAELESELEAAQERRFIEAVDCDAPLSSGFRPRVQIESLLDASGTSNVDPAEPCETTGQPQSKYLLAVAHADSIEQFGRAALRAGNLQTARRSLRLLTSITHVLARVDPRPIQAQRRAASALYDLGKAERKLGELESARDRFRRCAELFGSLLKAIPNDATTRRDLAVCLSKLGMVEKDRGDLPRAREVLRRCHASFEQLATSAPRDVGTLRDLGTALIRLAAVEDESGDLEAARELMQRNLDVAYAAAELEPSPSRGRIGILRALYRLAKLEVRLGNHPEARELFRLMLEDVEALTHADDVDAGAALDLVLLHAEHPSQSASSH